MNQIQAYPLSWPAGWKRTESSRRGRPKFLSEFGRARNGLLNELKLFGATRIVLSTNIPLTKDGLPYANCRNPDDPGVAVFFERKGKPACLACDKWQNIAENTRALQLTVDAMRGIDRWGSSELMERSFQGFTALPAPEAKPARPWRDVLDAPLSLGIGIEGVKQRRNGLLRLHHPDIGTYPSHEKTAEINKAFEEAERELGA